MRLSLVGPVYPYRGGIAHYTTLLARALEESHRVQVVSFKRQYPRWLYPGSSDRDTSCQPFRVPASYILDPLYPWTWLSCSRSIASFGAEVAILQWWVPFWAPAFGTVARMLKRSGVRVIYICHNVLPHERKLWDKALARWALSPANALIVHSQDETIAARELSRASIYTHPHPSYASLLPDLPEKTKAREALGIREDRVLLFFGLVRPYKGLRYLLEAFALAFPAGGARLVVAGEFWEPLVEYHSLAARLGIAASVLWAPRYIPNEEAPAYFAAADAVVVPYTSVTQSGVVQMAFGAGRPVITTNVGGLPEIVTDGETGLLVPPADSPSLAVAIRRFYEENLGSRMAEVIKRQQARFSWGSLVRLIEEAVGRGQDC